VNNPKVMYKISEREGMIRPSANKRRTGELKIVVRIQPVARSIRTVINSRDTSLKLSKMR